MENTTDPVLKLAGDDAINANAMLAHQVIERLSPADQDQLATYRDAGADIAITTIWRFHKKTIEQRVLVVTHDGPSQEVFKLDYGADAYVEI